MDITRKKEVYTAAVTSKPDYASLSNRFSIYLILYTFIMTTHHRTAELAYSIWLFIDAILVFTSVYVTSAIKRKQLFDIMPLEKVSNIVSLFTVDTKMIKTMSIAILILACSLAADGHQGIALFTVIVSFVYFWNMTLFYRYILAYVIELGVDISSSSIEQHHKEAA